MINSAALKRLGRNDDGSPRMTLQLMTGFHPCRLIARIIPQVGSQDDTICLEKARAQQRLSINAIEQQLETLHKEAFDTILKRQKKAIAAHCAAKTLLKAYFQLEDILLVRPTTDKGLKLHFR